LLEETIAMPNDVREPRTARQWRVGLAVALIGAIVVGATGAARAHDDDDDWKPKKRHHHDAPYYVVVPPGHVRYVAPPPVVYMPPPVVVYPAPVMGYPDYSGPPGGSINLGVTVPLR
jgi:hypothetical protein